MNFVHFPKLDEYAIDPELVQNSLDLNQSLHLLHAKSFSSNNIFPNVLLKRSRRFSKYSRHKEKQLRESVDAGTRGSNVHFPLSNLRGLSQFKSGKNSPRDASSPRSNFFKKWDTIPLLNTTTDFSTASNSEPYLKDLDNLNTASENSELFPQTKLSSSVGSIGKGSAKETISALQTSCQGNDELNFNAEIATSKRHKKSPKLLNVFQTVTLSRSNSCQKDKDRFDWPTHKIVEKFRNTILAVKVVVKLAKTIMKTSDSPSALLKTFTALSTAPKENEEEKSSENMKKYGLHFDPSYFKANREISLSSEVRSILKLHPDRRTQEQIQTTVFGLQSIPSFAEYPLHMQEKLAKVAWLDIVTPNRTIIRQGHFAENFYFIVSGQALVTIHRPGDASAQTAALMRKGTSFGELALLHHSRRTATVTSHDTVQLLSVGRDDFFDIFMSRHIKGEIPEHIKFLSQLDFMKDWPIERLLERPDQCLLHFFKRNMVIVKDSHRSDWLYVVKSGSCQVLKQLKGVTAKLGPSRSPRQSQTDRLSRPRGSLFEGNDNDEKRSSKQDNRLQTTESDYNNDLEKVASSAVLDSAVSKSKTRDDPVFVRIELLKPMDVFGLDLVNFNSGVEVESTSVSLVSLGSECIMLSKHFFMKHANDKVKKRLSETVTPYPNEATLQDSLQHKVNWELYKQSILNAAFTKCKLLKRKFLAVH
ncbi:uncharacterized protein LOC106062845 isoform X1 [Biomphalaria glabrata]|uniref:Uncharacterized protein LOC106062845 isoform X1 n=1 Tax=Biomphalaria glabrata TaxID=6526 RepID=A0A9W3A1X7_BIOGL|nr:uncharacterized protein LOC106062845 isoform X1 [Biomphalaria glabrata]